MRSGRRTLRRRLALVVALGAFGIFGAAGLAKLDDGSGPPSPPSPQPSLIVEVLGDGRTLQRLDASAARRDGRIDTTVLRRIVSKQLVRRRVITRGRARIDFRISDDAVIRRVLTSGGSPVRVVATPRSVSIAAPVVAQTLRNNCETAALEVLLTTVGRRLPQLTLQAELERSGPLDPVDGDGGSVWGDPDLGYVGRPDGGGAAGGFGVYQAPIQRLAGRRGVQLEDLTASRLATLLTRLREGRAVMIWVGLSDGPYRRWISPDGRAIRANLGEHTVVLTGVSADGRVTVVNVLEGTKEIWTQTQLLAMWSLLGRRALAAPPPS